MGTIRIIGASEEVEAQSKGILGSGTSAPTVSEVDATALQKNLNNLVTELGGALDSLDDHEGFKLKQFTVGVEISAKGGVSLIGKLEAGAKAAVSLVFERS